MAAKSPEEKESVRLKNLIWRMSPKGRAYERDRIRSYSDSQKEHAKLQRKLYLKSSEGRAVRLAYERSEEVTAKRHAYAQARTRMLKIEGLIAYSSNPPFCACCGEREPSFLTIDHVNNDGRAERRNSSSPIYQRLRMANYPDKDRYQVLCMNCNFGKHINRGRCPHKAQSLYKKN